MSNLDDIEHKSDNRFTAKAAADAARDYRARGFAPIPNRKGKNPGFPNWQNFTCPDDAIDREFTSQNIGILLGSPSHGLCDVDLDTNLAVAAARYFLPETGLIGGHDERPGSHYFYRIVNANGEIQPNVKPEKFSYINEKKEGPTVIELRGDGQQTIVAPSRHPDYANCHYRWEQYGNPASVTYTELRQCAVRIAISATLAEHWPNPGRHNTGLCVAGLLYSCGVSEEEAKQLVFVSSTIDGHNRVDDRVKAVESTYSKARNGDRVTGIPSLAEIFPEPVINALKKWCDSIATEKREWWNGNGARRTEAAQEPEEPGEWPEPEPLSRELPAGEPFPLDALGDVLGGAAREMHAVIQAPEALCGQSVFAAANMAVQAHGDVEIDGRVSPVSAFFAALAVSGERKTATDRAATTPHVERHRELRNECAQQKADYEIKIAAWKKSREEALSSKNSTVHAKEEALKELGPEPQPPIETILTTGDFTIEGLVRSFANGWPSQGVFSDEAGQFIGGYGMEEKNQIRTVAGLSKFWDGSPISRTRGADGNTVLLGRRLSLHLMMQPEMGLTFFSNRTLLDQGVFSRFLVSFPESRIGDQKYQEQNLYVLPGMQRYYAQMKVILQAPLLLVDGTLNELNPPQLTLAPDAKREWMRFHDYIQDLMKPDRSLFPIRGFAAKAAEHVARLAGTLALVADLQTRTIEKQCLDAGVMLVNYYLNEALRLFSATASNPDLRLAERLLTWARLQPVPADLADRFTVKPLYLSAIYLYGPNAIRDKETAKRIVGILEAHGWIRRIKDKLAIDGATRKEAWEVRS